MKLSTIVMVLAAAATVTAAPMKEEEFNIRYRKGADTTAQALPTAAVTTPTATEPVATTAIASNPTLAPSTPIVTQTPSGCFEVSVEHDATYCIQGPICSGSGAAPAGTNCPVAGDVAIKDCHSWLTSYTGGKCIAPVSAICQKIKTGAWGCVLDKTATTPVVTGSIKPTTKPTAAPNGSSSGSLDAAASSASDMGSTDNETISVPVEKLNTAFAASGGSKDSGIGSFVGIASAVGVVAAVGAAVIHRKRRAAAAAEFTSEDFIATP